MVSRLFPLLLVFLVATSVHAQKPSPSPAPRGFWKVLVTPKAKWTLVDTIGEKKSPGRIVVETYDVRKVGAADVARLRWTRIWGPAKDDREDYGSSGEGRYTQVAVTPAGLYILSADMDDAKIAEALKRKPSRSDPPKAYKSSKQNEGRYLRVEGDDLVCMGYEPLPGAPDCADTCEGEACYSSTRGPVKLSGTWAPDMGIYAQP
jgi:hypothetical protein